MVRSTVAGLAERRVCFARVQSTIAGLADGRDLQMRKRLRASPRRVGYAGLYVDKAGMTGRETRPLHCNAVYAGNKILTQTNC